MSNTSSLTINPRALVWITQTSFGISEGATQARVEMAGLAAGLPSEAKPLWTPVTALSHRRKWIDRVRSVAAAPEQNRVGDDSSVYRQFYRQMRAQFFAAIRPAGPVPQQVAIQPVLIIQKPKSASQAKVTTRSLARHHGSVRVETVPGRSVRLATNTQSSTEDARGELIEAAVTPLATAYDVFRQQTENTYKEIAAIAQKLFGVQEASAQEIEKSAPVVAQWVTRMNIQNPTQSPRVPSVLQSQKLAQGAADKLSNDHLNIHGRQDGLRRNEYPIEVHPTPAPTLSPVTNHVVEAFEWSTPVEPVLEETLTTEGWMTIRAADHWPVIYWNPSNKNQAAMISNNTALMLAKRVDLALTPQADTGIVFGKLPAGWEVELSGRAEKVVYLDYHNGLAPTAEAPRTFAFLNVAPGTQMMVIKSVPSGRTSSVGFAVVNGASTYLDFTQMSPRNISGYVLDVGNEAAQPLAGVVVSIVGQANRVFLTGALGTFQFDSVDTISDMPLYLETASVTGYKHRYRVSPMGPVADLKLYRLSDQQIQGWVG
ncbi:hypothetical protein WDW37_10140, partial [Bdellovibrionota bacterium FG-1]